MDRRKDLKRSDVESGLKICKRLYTLRQDAFGSKKVTFAWQPSSGTLLASSIEGNPVVYIHNRQGQIEGQIPLQGNCLALSWDSDGDFLGIVTEGRSSILLWEAHTKRLSDIDSSLKDTGSSIAWAPTGKTLAYGTAKGNLLIYNHRSLTRVPIIGKHSKRIISCAWSNEGVLALATADNILSLNNSEGDAFKTVQLHGKPLDIKFGHLKEDHVTKNVHNTVSLIVGEKTLYLHRVDQKKVQGTPLELGFQARYGNLLRHNWLGDGYILASFSAGFIVTISTHHKEIGTEISLVELSEDPLRWTDLCPKTGQVCVCYGDNKVEIRDAVDPSQVKCRAEIEDEMGRMSAPMNSEFSADGELLAVATGAGDLHVFLTSVPLLGGRSGDYLVQLSSLTEVTVHAFVGRSGGASKCDTISLDVEPTLLITGPTHFGAVLNNRIWYYNTDSGDGSSHNSSRPFCIKEYNANVGNGALNTEYAALLTGDRIYLHPIASGEDNGEVKFFQESQGKRENRISCLALTKDFLFFGTEQGNLRMFHLERWEELNQLSVMGKGKLKSLHPDVSGTRVVITTKDGLGHFYDMRFDAIQQISNFPARVDGVHWDIYDGSTHVFLTFCTGAPTVDLFCYSRDAKAQIEVSFVRTIKIFPTLDNHPLCLRNGVIYSQTSTGRLTRTVDIYHERPEFTNQETGKREKLLWLLDLKKFRDAFNFCKAEKLPKPFWLKLARAASDSLALSYAKRAFSEAGNYGTAYNLSEFVLQDDLRLQQGFVHSIFGKYDEAESSFLNSSEQLNALRMRYDLRQWEEAYHLATELAPEECAEIGLRFAEQDELARNYSRALESYTNAAAYAQNYEHPVEFEAAKIGIGRNCLRCGQIQRGMEIIAQPEVPASVKRECAEILESTKFLSEGAQLYEEGGRAEKAAALLIRTKNWEKLDRLLPQVTSKKILLQYAKSREVEGSFRSAAESYQKASDVVNAVRLYLKGEDVEEAIQLVKETRSRDGGMLVASYFAGHDDVDTALRFLLITRLHEDAVQLTFQHGLFELFATLAMAYCEKEVPSGGTPLAIAEGFVRISEFYQGHKDHLKAAKFCHLGGELDKAFRILLRAGTSGMIQNEEEFLTLLVDLGVEMTADGENGPVGTELVEFLLGDKDGNPKDVKHLLRYYATVKRETEAVKTCLIYASDELRTGTYTSAHQAFVNTILQLRSDDNRAIPAPLYNAFKLVHFYYLAKLQVSAERDSEAGRLLQFVYPEYQAFSQHALELLTLAVVECSKAGLRETALDACCTLMKTDMRHDIDPQYKKKFELLVRKRGKGGADVVDVPDEASPCPRCEAPLLNYTHHCTSCDTEIPFCIFSGRHLVAGDFTYCPYCQFPGLYSELVKLSYALLQRGKPLRCPICRTKRVPRESYKKHGFVDAFLGNRWIGAETQLNPEFLDEDEDEDEDGFEYSPGDAVDTDYSSSDHEGERAYLEAAPRKFDHRRTFDTIYL